MNRNKRDQMRIAGWRTPGDWQALKSLLLTRSDQADWEKAYTEYCVERLRLRYLEPSQVLRENSSYQGEGFSMVAIQCSLVEFLESTVQGLKYRYLRRGEKLGLYEYSSTKDIFVKFLTARKPFCEYFDTGIANDFYAGVRCGLLHEATTRNGWRIWGKDRDDRIIDPTQKIIFRDNMQDAFLAFISEYKGQLISTHELQLAFIRKFDSLCE